MILQLSQNHVIFVPKTKQKHTTMEHKDPIAEAVRYQENAKQIILDNENIEDGYYEDGKHVKKAGRMMWKGCLIALNFAFQFKHNSDKDIKDYQNAAAKRSKKLLNIITSGYQTMHLWLGYDGAKSVSTMKEGRRLADEIIEWCRNNAATPAVA